jgi:hypothetical protein
MLQTVNNGDISIGPTGVFGNNDEISPVFWRRLTGRLEAILFQL